MNDQRQFKTGKRLVFTVTNELNFDQRMIRICTSLQKNGYNVLLIGRNKKGAPLLQEQPFRQKRLNCIFEQGKLFYIEYNLRLFLYLLFLKTDLICAIDLDTIVPCLITSRLKNTKRVYDAHELFCEMKEIVTRPAIYKIWKFIERNTVPKFKHGYTVNEPIREIFRQTYQVDYKVIMNVPFLQEQEQVISKEPFILYQGAVNHGRSFETLIPAFQWIDYPLYIYGDGNFLGEAYELVKKYHLENKVIFKGKVPPKDLKNITPKATLGITLFENNGLNNYFSLANRFFDYIQACTPQICVKYPVYAAINNEDEIAVLIEDLSSENISRVINSVLNDQERMRKLYNNCKAARLKYNWQQEEKKLIAFYSAVFANE